MEPTMEIRFTAEKKMLLEFYRKVSGIRLPSLILTLVLILVLNAIATWVGIQDYVNGFLGFICCVSIILYIMPFFLVWTNLCQTIKQNDGQLPQCIITVDDTIELHEGMMHITIEYRKIQKILHLKHSYVLMLGKRNGVIIDPNGFTKGTFAEFKQLLREKCPNLLIPE